MKLISIFLILVITLTMCNSIQQAPTDLSKMDCCTKYENCNKRHKECFELLKKNNDSAATCLQDIQALRVESASGKVRYFFIGAGGGIITGILVGAIVSVFILGGSGH